MTAPAQIAELLDEGDGLARRNAPEEALALYDRVLSLDPRNVGALERKVFVLTGQGRRDDALSTQERLIALEPEDTRRRVVYADLLLAAGRQEAAIAGLEEAVRLEPSDPRLLERLGEVYRSSGDSGRALEIYEKALSLAPYDGRLWATKADALIDAERGDEAVEALDRAARVDTAFLDADWNLRADRFYISGDYERAALLYGRAIDTRPNVASWRGLGLTSQATGDFGEALRCYERALELEPDNVQLLNDRGYALIELGRMDEAQECFRAVVRHAPDSLDGWMNLGWTCRETDQPVEAYSAYSRAARLAPEDSDVWLNTGLCELEIGERTTAFENALVSFERSLQLDDDSFWAWNNAGWVLGELGRYDEAMRHLERALDLDRSEVTPWRNKIVLLLNHGETTAAQRCLDEMMEVVTDRATALNVKASVLTDWLGRDEDALEVSYQADRERPGDESITANIAETLLKVGRLADARAAAQDVLATAPSTNARCVMLFVVWASHVLEGGDSGERARAFVEFVDHFRESFLSGPGRSLEWTYAGLKRTLPVMAPSTEARFLLTLAIDLQEGRLPVGELSFFAEQEQLPTARAR